MDKTHTHISHLISCKKEGSLIFPTDFKGKGSEAAIHKALSRLVRDGSIKRLAHGIYYLPKTDPLLGEMYPSPEEVARLIAKKEKVRIRPTGVYALNRLGLSTQVPMKLVYLTDGVPRQLRIGRTTIRFKATTAKKLALKGELSALIILALEELDLDHVTPEQETRLRQLLRKEDPRKLRHDLALAPGRVHDYIVKLLKTNQDDRMADTNG